MKGHVYLLAPSFFPIGVIGAHRPYRLGKYLVKRGWKVEVFAWKYNFYGNEDSAAQRAAERIFSDLHYVASGWERLAFGLMRVHRKIGYFLWRAEMPYQGYSWGKRVVRAILQKHARRGTPGVLWVCMNPYGPGVAAVRNARRAGMPVVLDYRDPWTVNPYYQATRPSWKIQWDRKGERLMLQHADAVVFTARDTRDAMVREFPFIRAKSYVVYNGVDEDAILTRLQTGKRSQKLKMIYTGALYGARHPRVLLRAMAQYVQRYGERYELILIGQGSVELQPLIRAHGLEEVVRCRPPVSRQEAIAMLEHADVALLINGIGKEYEMFIPGKFYDYLAAMKPMFCVGGGEVAEWIEKHNLGVAVPHCEEEIIRGMRKMYERWEQFHYGREKVMQWSAAHSAAAMEEVFLSVFDQKVAAGGE